MLPISLNLRHKKVLLIGGGQVAYRKMKLFLKEEAIITVIAPLFKKELECLDIERIQKEYDQSDLKGYFMVYAATDDDELNNQIVEDCNRLHILCGSATYNEQASFYSMGSIETDVGTVALSMHQKLPYHKPLLSKMAQVLNDNEERIELLTKLRPYVIQLDNKKHYFDLLYNCSIELLRFIEESLKGQGYLFVYHQSKYDENFSFSSKPSYVMTLQEFKEKHELFLPFKAFHIIPLVLSDGYIYKTIRDLLPEHVCNLPLVSCIEDALEVMKCFETSRTTYYFIHPQSNEDFKKLFQQMKPQDRIYDFNEDLQLDQNTSYQFVVLLMTHGQHYYDLIHKFEQWIEKGYDIEYTGCLLDNERIVKMIEK